MSDVFTEDERRYMYGFKPAGFLRSWHSLYQTKCIGGPWTLSRRHITFGAVERGNRWSIGRTLFEPNILGWHITIPLGFGSLALWGYRRVQP